MATVYSIMLELGAKETEFETHHKLLEVKGSELFFENVETGENVTDSADMIVLSLGVSPAKAVEDMLAGKVGKLFTVGDCAEGTKIPHATGGGFQAAWGM